MSVHKNIINRAERPGILDVNWMYTRRSEDALNVFWTSYVRSIYALWLGGSLEQFRNNWGVIRLKFFNQYFSWQFEE